MVDRDFPSQHIGPDPSERQLMLERLGYDDLDAFVPAEQRGWPIVETTKHQRVPLKSVDGAKNLARRGGSIVKRTTDKGAQKVAEKLLREDLPE